MTEQDKTGRPNQRRRTRKDLLLAAARLLKQGRNPTLEEIAEEAMVSRATAYRYFQNVEALLVEAALDIVTPSAEDLFAGDASRDPVRRVERVDEALDEMIAANEASLRTMLAHSLQRGLRGDGDIPARQNRRSPLIEAALAPAADEFTPEALQLLISALSLTVGTEAMVAFKDVMQLDDVQARRVKRWMISALVSAARKGA